MQCPYCNADNRDGVRYCGKCGNLLMTAAPLAAGGNGSGTFSEHDTHFQTPGSRLQGGRYVVKRVLGQGGMGAALLATDIRLDNKLVVIKELISDSTDPARWQDDVRNFKREVAMLAHLDHPLIPNVTDHFQEGPRYFMVQEYVEGETLEERMERLHQPMRERNVLVCATEILDVLEYLSQQTPPVVHRDIKPANIIIGAKDRRAHLVDFGIARADEAKNVQRRQTSALGTPGYAPPEQYQGNADPRSDVYALAATMHHLLTNRDPRNYAPFSYPPVRTLDPQLSPEIENVLTRALQNEMQQRYQSAAVMKRDVDDILLRRFGISGQVNSYVLGSFGPARNETATVASTSGAYPAIPTQTTGPTFAVQHSPVHATPPNLPLQPLSPQQGYISAPQPRRRRTGLYAMLALLLLLLIIISTFAAFNFLPHAQTSGSTATPNVTTSSGIGVTKIGNDIIGISDGSVIFDSGRSDGPTKQQAADRFKQNNSDGVIAALSTALEQEPNDAEAHIYLEDQRVVSSGNPYITLVVGTMLSPDNVGVGRDDLQGAYIAQKEFNDGSKLLNGLKVRLLIANSGSKATYAINVAQQIVQLAQHDKTFVGVMGWPFSSRALNAIRVLSEAHIPMVSQTSSSDELTNISQYFFRVVPSNKIQGVSGAQYAEQVLHANSAALFVDPADSYSQSLANDFVTQFEHDGKQIVAKEEYTVGKTSNFATLLQDALQHNPSILYFSGYAADISTLLTNLPPGNNIPVMGGDALYELNGYQSSARAGFTHLRFTAFAYPDEWDILGQTAHKPPFFAAYAQAFSGNGAHSGYGYTRPDNDVVLSYDATIALLNACNAALGSGKTQLVPENVRQALIKTTFQGVSGQIAFGSDGDPVNKAIVILSVDSQGKIHMELPVEGQFFK
jgi:serine/threonine protein kinase